MNYCFEIYKKALHLNNDKMKEFLGYLKSQTSSLANIRLGYYCSLCNGDEQKYFNMDTKRIEISEGFCFNLIKTGKDYLNFVNIVLIEYLSFMNELKNCYEGGPSLYTRDKFLTKYKRRIPLFKTCF